MKIRKLSLLLFLLTFFMSCAYDNLEDRGPDVFCDTVGLLFNENIFQIFQTNCFTCHSGLAPQGDILLTDYIEITDTIQKILELISLDSDDSNLMPPGGKLPNCSIEQIEQWIEDGMPN